LGVGFGIGCGGCGGRCDKPETMEKGEFHGGIFNQKGVKIVQNSRCFCEDETFLDVFFGHHVVIGTGLDIEYFGVFHIWVFGIIYKTYFGFIG
jgi:hypothetical protein